jgi:phage shock protein C
MSDSNWKIDLEPLRGLYRDTDNAWICGVCAGVAERFDLQLSTVRIIAVISLALFFWLTAAIYLGATLLLKEKPLIYSGSRTEYEFWRRRNRDDWSHT